MAKVRDDLGGAISGLIGPIVYYNFNGKTYIRSKMKERPKNSWSPEQVIYRQKVSRTAAFWKELVNNPVRQTYNLAAENMSGYNLFLKTNLPAFNSDGTQMDLERLHVSFGKLPLPHLLKAIVVESDPTKWNVSWKNDSGIGLSHKDDELMVVFAHDGTFSHPITTSIQRIRETAMVQVPQGTGILQGIYLFFASTDRKLYSVDQFIGI